MAHLENQHVQRVEVECVRCWPESGWFVGGKEVVVRLGAGMHGWKCDGQVNAVMVRPLTRGHQASAMRLRQGDMSILADDELGNYPNKQGQVYSALARFGKGITYFLLAGNTRHISVVVDTLVPHFCREMN